MQIFKVCAILMLETSWIPWIDAGVFFEQSFPLALYFKAGEYVFCAIQL